MLHRRRLGLSKVAFADQMGVGVKRYRRWENGDEVFGGELPQLGDLKIHERLYLYRYRAGISREKIAERVGVSPWWITAMESGRAPGERLRLWWERHRRVYNV
jgi:transcriptional regulator with XRE-family HTH domain